MSPTRRALTLALVMAGLASAASAQEIGPYVGGGVGGIRDVRRPFGAGVTGTLLFHDWIGVRGDAGYYWTLEHRRALACKESTTEAKQCESVELSSHSRFPLLAGMAIVRARVPGKGIRFEVGAGPSWVRVTNEIRTQRDSIWSPKLTSSRMGLSATAGLLAHPQWRMPVTLQAAYVYHMTRPFGACTNQPNDPICGQHLNFHELRFAALFAPRYLNR